MQLKEMIEYTLAQDTEDVRKYKALTEQTDQLRAKLEALDKQRAEYAAQLKRVNKWRWPVIQKLYKFINHRFNYFDFDRVKEELW